MEASASIISDQLDVVVVPSHREYTKVSPLMMFEAIGSRTPIVCSDHPMFLPVLKDGVHTALSDLYACLSANADRTWAALKGPADWRRMPTKWILEGRESDWIDQHMLVPASA